MRFVKPSFVTAICLMLCCFTGIAALAADGPTAGDIEVRRDFETILDLWRDGRFGDLYDRTYAAGSRSRESFLRKMSAADRRPACCWEKMQDVKVTISGTDSATLRVRIGLERTGTETDSCTRSFRLRRESGVWKASLSDILSVAGASRKKSSWR
jgi:hypothetical protein